MLMTNTTIDDVISIEDKKVNESSKTVAASTCNSVTNWHAVVVFPAAPYLPLETCFIAMLASKQQGGMSMILLLLLHRYLHTSLT